MIVFDLQCADGGEVFEAWFRSNSDYDEQLAGGLIRCPCCGSSDVRKAPMAPLIPRSVGRPGKDVLSSVAELQARLLENSSWVGDRFAETARAMHLGETEPKPIHGQATAAEAKGLVDDGVPVAPLPLPVVPPNQVN